MTNPQTAIDTILNTETEIFEDIKVFPVTLARYALLELVESPFVTPDTKFTINDLVPSFFICCAKSDELKLKVVLFLKIKYPQLISLLMDIQELRMQDFIMTMYMVI